jgi:PAS domain S-box-containing protein
LTDECKKARDAGHELRNDPGPAYDHDSEMGLALRTMLGWRRAPTLAVNRHGGTLVESNRGGAQSTPKKGRQLPCSAPKWAASEPGRPFDFGDLRLRLIGESLDRDASNWEIPSLVTDTMLRRIVEAHFAVWYVWHVPTGVCIVPGMRELLDIPERSVPTIVEEWLGRVHPSDLPRMIAENDMALRSGSPFRSEYRLLRGNGSYVSISDWGIVLSGDDGGYEWMAGGIRDITSEKALDQAREESAQLREMLFDRALMPAFLVDSSGNVVEASQSGLHFLQIERDALVGRPATEIFPTSVTERTECVDSLDEATRDVSGTTEVELHVAGDHKWLLTTVVPFGTGDARMALVLGADITERRRTAEALARSEATLREKSEALERHNVALRVIMDQRRSDLEDHKRIIAEDVKQLVFPILNRLAVAFSDRPETALLDVVIQTLNDIADRPVEAPGESLDYSQRLTRRQHEVLQLIRAGRTTDEIARTLFLSPATVTFHRGNIRRKLGLRGSGIQLTPRVGVARVSSHPEHPPAEYRGGQPIGGR